MLQKPVCHAGWRSAQWGVDGRAVWVFVRGACRCAGGAARLARRRGVALVARQDLVAYQCGVGRVVAPRDLRGPRRLAPGAAWQVLKGQRGAKGVDVGDGGAGLRCCHSVGLARRLSWRCGLRSDRALESCWACTMLVNIYLVGRAGTYEGSGDLSSDVSEPRACGARR